MAGIFIFSEDCAITTAEADYDYSPPYMIRIGGVEYDTAGGFEIGENIEYQHIGHYTLTLSGGAVDPIEYMGDLTILVTADTEILDSDSTGYALSILSGKTRIIIEENCTLTLSSSIGIVLNCVGKPGKVEIIGKQLNPENPQGKLVINSGYAVYVGTIAQSGHCIFADVVMEVAMEALYRLSNDFKFYRTERTPDIFDADKSVLTYRVEPHAEPNGYLQILTEDGKCFTGMDGWFGVPGTTQSLFIEPDAGYYAVIEVKMGDEVVSSEAEFIMPAADVIAYAYFYPDLTLDDPANLRWDDENIFTGEWDIVTGADSYNVKLYKVEGETDSLISEYSGVTSASCNFSDYISAGTYYFTVTAEGEGKTSSDEVESPEREFATISVDVVLGEGVGATMSEYFYNGVEINSFPATVIAGGEFTVEVEVTGSSVIDPVFSYNWNGAPAGTVIDGGNLGIAETHGVIDIECEATAERKLYDVAIIIRKDGVNWSISDIEFTLYCEGCEAFEDVTSFDGTTIHASLHNEQYQIFLNFAASGFKFTPSDANLEFFMNFYQVNVSTSIKGTATSSLTSIYYNGVEIESGDIVLEGGQLIVAVEGQGAPGNGPTYQYDWENVNSSYIAENTVQIDSLNEVVNDIRCEVTGDNGTFEGKVTATLDGAPRSGIAVKVVKGGSEWTLSETAAGSGEYARQLYEGTYSVYYGGVDSHISLVITTEGGQAALTFFTVDFELIQAGTAGTTTESEITATYDGVEIESGDIVLSGGALIITAQGKGALGAVPTYTYAWSGSGFDIPASTGTASISVSELSSVVNATCEVTGYNGTFDFKITVTLDSAPYGGLDVSVSADGESFISFTEESAGVYRASLYEGSYEVYIGGEAIGVTALATTDDSGDAEVLYFTVDFTLSKTNAPTSTITAVYFGTNTEIADGTTVLLGTSVTFKAVGGGAGGTGPTYSYEWFYSDEAEPFSTDAEVTVTYGEAKSVECIVTGHNGTFSVAVAVLLDGEAFTDAPLSFEAMFYAEGSDIALSGEYADGITEAMLCEGIYTIKIDGVTVTKIEVAGAGESINVEYFNVKLSSTFTNAPSSAVLALCNGDALDMGEHILLGGSGLSITATGNGAEGVDPTYDYIWTGSGFTVPEEGEKVLTVDGLSGALDINVEIVGINGTFSATVILKIDNIGSEYGEVTIVKGVDSYTLSFDDMDGEYSASGIAEGVYSVYVDGDYVGVSLTVGPSGSGAIVGYWTISFEIDSQKGTVSGDTERIVLDGRDPEPPTVTAKAGYSFNGFGTILAADRPTTYTAAFTSTAVTVSGAPESLTAAFGNSYTEAAPLVDFGALITIVGDAEAGQTVYYTIKSGGLPSGLILTNAGLIYGRPEAAVEEVSVTFEVHAKNGNSDEFTVVFTVTKFAAQVVWANFSGLVFNGLTQGVTATVSDAEGHVHNLVVDFYKLSDYRQWEENHNYQLEKIALRNAGEYMAYATLSIVSGNPDFWENYEISGLTKEVSIAPYEVDVEWELTVHNGVEVTEYVYSAAVQEVKAYFKYINTNDKVYLDVIFYDAEEFENPERIPKSFREVGSYLAQASIKSSYAEKNNYALKADNSVKNFTMKKFTRAVEWKTDSNYTYNGNIQTKSDMAKFSRLGGASQLILDIKCYLKSEYDAAEGNTSELPVRDFKDAGEYVLVASFKEDDASAADSYIMTEMTKTLVINKKAVALSWGETKSQYNYTGSNLAVKVKAFASGINGAPKEQLDFVVTIYRVEGETETAVDTMTEIGVYRAVASLNPDDAAFADNYAFSNQSKTIKIVEPEDTEGEDNEPGGAGGEGEVVEVLVPAENPEELSGGEIAAISVSSFIFVAALVLFFIRKAIVKKK
ncbi:MAG TPA: putative Ig domain-containing protein [Eubacteriales bacterium]|nr:putative Ig domain-containing protein [Eubacteriales bacterium]